MQTISWSRLSLKTTGHWKASAIFFTYVLDLELNPVSDRWESSVLPLLCHATELDDSTTLEGGRFYHISSQLRFDVSLCTLVHVPPPNNY